MIDLETIEREINELETRYDTSYRVCERLSWLYTVRNNLRGGTQASRTPTLKGSEFLELASDVDYRSLMSVLDEHMQSVAMAFPKSYDSLLDKLRQLH